MSRSIARVAPRRIWINQSKFNAGFALIANVLLHLGRRPFLVALVAVVGFFLCNTLKYHSNRHREVEICNITDPISIFLVTALLFSLIFYLNLVNPLKNIYDILLMI